MKKVSVRHVLRGMLLPILLFFSACPFTSIPTYTVTYEGNGNTSGNAPTDANAYPAGTAVTVADAGTLAKEGAAFSCWNTAADGGGTDMAAGELFEMENADVTLYAQWTSEGMYTVSFDEQGGSAVDPITTSPIRIIPVSTRDGYALEGWYSDGACTAGNKISFPYTPDSTITLYAKWISSTSGLAFVLKSPGYAVYKGTADTNGSVLIPEYWLGKHVIAVGDSAFYECNNMTGVVIPDSVASIGRAAFLGCTSLTALTLPVGVTSIGSSAFCVCTSLASLTIPSGVTAIEEYTFFGCTSLATLTIPSGVTAVGKYAFYCCTHLVSVNADPAVPPVAGVNMFGQSSSLTAIKVPAGSLDAYKAAAGWRTYAGIIQPQ